MAECVFCKISQHQLPAAAVFEDADVIAFSDIQPKAPLHILVVPKQHIPAITHLEADHSMIIAKLIYTAKRVAAERQLDGYKLVFNVGRAGGQTVDHLHLHLLGGWEKPDDWKKGFAI